MTLQTLIRWNFLLGCVTVLQAHPELKSSQSIQRYCLECHDSLMEEGDLDLESGLSASFNQSTDVWERVVRKLEAYQMPPSGEPLPDPSTREEMISELTEALDKVSEIRYNPGRTEPFRRLTRTEYQNAIRDLLAVEFDAASLLPKDESSHGFDNITVGSLSPTLLNRYITAAQKISRLAVGASEIKPGGATYRAAADITQESHVEGLPLGTRGGMLIRHTFSHDAEYEIRIRLARDRNEEIEGLNGRYELDLLLDQRRIERFIIDPPKIRSDYESVDRDLVARIPVSAGLHEVGVTFVDHSDALLERKRKPYSVAFNMHRHPRLSPAIYQVNINGPFDIQGPGSSASREKIFSTYPECQAEELDCAKKIISRLARRAFRRPVNEFDLEQPIRFYHQGYEQGGFESGIESALSAILISPQFLFKIEEDPISLPAETAYEISDFQLASRLSFFIWSSLPDEELLNLAEAGLLSEPETLAQKTERMLNDPRAENLVTNFANQWLYLRNLDTLTPDARLFPDFDENLRRAMRRETELLFETVLKENRSVLDLLQADFTYLNERLARHYNIPGVLGSHFRKVSLQPEMQRGGLLRQGSVLSVTSYATRTSPVIRGNWILGNLMGVPPPPPPPNIPALEDNSVDATLPMRQRLSQHRENKACASCHDLLDPVGFSLENYDAIGRWRTRDQGQPVDASGGLPGSDDFEGVGGLEKAILERPELFVRTLAEKLLKFALGRGVETFDAPAIRKILKETGEEDYRIRSVILGVVKSRPFLMRKTAP